MENRIYQLICNIKRSDSLREASQYYFYGMGLLDAKMEDDKITQSKKRKLQRVLCDEFEKMQTRISQQNIRDALNLCRRDYR